MGFLDNILGTKKKPSELVVLTELGKTRADNLIGASGSIRLRIMNFLEEHSEGATREELASSLRLPQDKVKMMVDKLIREQWVTESKSLAD